MPLRFVVDTRKGRRETRHDERRVDSSIVLGCQQLQAVDRVRHMDAHLFAGTNVDRRPAPVEQAVSALTHAVQRRTALVHYRHGFHER